MDSHNKPFRLTCKETIVSLLKKKKNPQPNLIFQRKFIFLNTVSFNTSNEHENFDSAQINRSYKTLFV